MPIEGFDFTSFAQNISQEAAKSCPPELTPELKDFLVKTIHYFCYKAGEGLIQEDSGVLNAKKVETIVQYIAELLFRKGLSLIYSQIPGNLWEHILQNIAIAIYNSGKQALSTNKNHDEQYDIISSAVEATIKNTFSEFKQQGQITDEQIKSFSESSSGVQQMLAPAVQTSVDKSTQQNSDLTPMQAKLSTIAILLSTFSQDKVNKILASFSQEEAQTIQYFMNQDQSHIDLDPKTTYNLLKSLKKTIAPNFTPSQISKNIQKLASIYNKDNIMAKLSNERPILKTYVLSCLEGRYMEKEISPYIGKIILRYLEKELAIG